MCIFCRSLFVLLYFFFWSLCCLFLFDMQILITPLVSSNSSSNLCIISIQNSLATFPNLCIIPVQNSLSPPPKAMYHTYPEFTGHIPKSLFIVIPSSKEIDTTILSSLKHLNHRTKSGFCFIKSIFLLTYMTSEVQDISEAYTHLILQSTP